MNCTDCHHELNVHDAGFCLECRSLTQCNHQGTNHPTPKATGKIQCHRSITRPGQWVVLVPGIKAIYFPHGRAAVRFTHYAVDLLREGKLP